MKSLTKLYSQTKGKRKMTFVGSLFSLSLMIMSDYRFRTIEKSFIEIFSADMEKFFKLPKVSAQGLIMMMQKDSQEVITHLKKIDPNSRNNKLLPLF